MYLTRRSTMRTGLSLAAASAIPPARAAQMPSGVQAPAFYRMKVGDIEITAVNDGIGFSPLEGLVLNAPVGDVKAALAEAFLPTDRFVTSYTTLVVNSGGRLALIDTGNGDSGPATTGHWAANLRAAGIDPARIDVIVFSHLHPDHINGARLKDGTDPFPQAEIMMPAPEWAFWSDDNQMARANPRMQAQFAGVRRVFGPRAKDITLFQWGGDVLPGVTALPAPGHTPGHTIFAFASNNATFMLLSDVTNNPALFARRPDFAPVFDIDAEVARQTRHRVLDLVSAERTRVSFYHAAFPATGYVEKRGAGYDFVPATWMPNI